MGLGDCPVIRLCCFEGMEMPFFSDNKEAEQDEVERAEK